jgi:hypothetical protein
MASVPGPVVSVDVILVIQAVHAHLGLVEVQARESTGRGESSLANACRILVDDGSEERCEEEGDAGEEGRSGRHFGDVGRLMTGKERGAIDIAEKECRILNLHSIA